MLPIWGGLYLEGLIHGRAYFRNFTVSSVTIHGPYTPSDKQVLSDIFGSCRRYPTINSSAKSVETVKTTSYKENIACEARSAVKSPPVVKSSPPIVKRSRPFPFDAVWSEAAYPVVQNYMQGAPRCQTLTERVRRHQDKVIS